MVQQREKMKKLTHKGKAVKVVKAEHSLDCKGCIFLNKKGCKSESAYSFEKKYKLEGCDELANTKYIYE